MCVLAVRIGPVQQLELAAALARLSRLAGTEETPVQQATALAPGQTLLLVGIQCCGGGVRVVGDN